MTHRVIGTLGIAISMWLMPACISARGASGTTKVSIATSGSGGYYYSLCKAMEKAGKDRDLAVDCRTSKGSQDNVYKLDNNEVDFALVQGDVAHRAWRGEYPFEESHDGIKLVTPLFTEKLHVLVRPHQYMTSMSQLKGKRIWLGGKDSGSRLSAFTVMLAAGMSSAELKNSVKRLDNRAAFALIRSDRGTPALDAVIDSDLPIPLMVSTTLDSFGIKRYDGSDAPHGATILLRPDLNLNSLADLSGKNVRLGRECSKEKAVELSSDDVTVTPADSESNTSQLEALRDKQIDALVEPNDLPPAFIAEILAIHGNRMFRLGTATTKKGKQELEVFLPRNSKISSAADLVDKKLWWPADDDILNDSIAKLIPGATASGTGRSLIHATRDIDTPMATELLRQGELDAVFQVTVAPSSGLEKIISQKTEVSLMGVDWPMVEKLVEDGSYVETSLQPSEYHALDRGVYTVGVQTLLLTRLGDSPVDQKKVAMVAQLLHDEEDQIEDALGITQKEVADKNGTGSAEHLAVAPNVMTLLGSPVNPRLAQYIHSAADPYLVKRGIRHRALIEISILMVMVLIICGLALLMEWGRHFAVYYPADALLVTACFLVWAIGAVWLQAVEGDISQEFSCFHEAGLSLALSVIHHFGLPMDVPQATTRSGQFTLEVFSWLGVLLVGAFCIPFGKRIWKQGITPRLEKMRAPDVLRIKNGRRASRSVHEPILKTTA